MLENGYWNNLDWLCNKKEYDLDDILAFVFDITEKYTPDIVSVFTETLAYYIHHHSRLYVMSEDNLANDDWIFPEFKSKCEFRLTSNFNKASSDAENTYLETKDTIKLEFNKTSYHYPRRKIAVKSQRSYFSPMIVS